MGGIKRNSLRNVALRQAESAAAKETTMRRMAAAWAMAAAVGCGGDEGTSPQAETCAQLGRACGYDNSGRECGRCPVDRACAVGQCLPLCAPSCTDRPCGTTDGCGALCAGACAGGQVCLDGRTCSPVEPSTPPARHTLNSGNLPAFRAFSSVTFTIPVPMTVSFGASSQLDTFSVGIFTPANWASYSGGLTSAQAFEFRQRVAGSDGRAALQAGTYYLGFMCDDASDRGCSVQYTVSATY